MLQVDFDYATRHRCATGGGKDDNVVLCACVATTDAGPGRRWGYQNGGAGAASKAASTSGLQRRWVYGYKEVQARA
jgi:hypothetical protein